MGPMLIAAGLLLALGAAAGLARECLRAQPAASFPRSGWIALAALAGLELLLALRVGWVSTYFTALVWTAYLFVADAAVRRLRGRSLFQSPARAAALALLSIPVWYLFEAYNFRLRNWIYTGMPRNGLASLLGANWAFATILPGIFLTAELLYAAHFQAWRCRPWRPGGLLRAMLAGLGFALVAVPLLLPANRAAYLFGLVWVGFVLLLDPLNAALGWPSLLADLRRGLPGRALALLASGLVCGFFWEFWNFWAAARWRYVFPIAQQWKIFAMPLPGFLGFPPFALECFALWIFFSRLLLPAGLAAGVCDEVPGPGLPQPAQTLK